MQNLRLWQWGRSIPASGLLVILASAHATPPPAADWSAPGPGATLPSATPAETEPPLTMEEAARLSVADQPLLTGREAKIRAEDQQAFAAAQLHDPQLSA